MDLLSAVLMLIGSCFALLAAVGLHRFDSVFARMHAAGKSATFGLGLILIGAALRLGALDSFAKLALVGILAVVTIPAGVHLIARSAWRVGTEVTPATHLDELSRQDIEDHRRRD